MKLAAPALALLCLGCFDTREGTGPGPDKETLHFDNLGLFLYFQREGEGRTLALSEYADSVYRRLDTARLRIDSVRDTSVEFGVGFWVKTVFVQPGYLPAGWEAFSEERAEYGRVAGTGRPEGWLACEAFDDSLQVCDYRLQESQPMVRWNWNLKHVEGKGLMLSMPMLSHNGDAIFDTPLRPLTRPLEGKLRIFYWK